MQVWKEIGPTVADQADYALPDNTCSVLKLEVNAVPWEPSGAETADRIATNDLVLRAPTGGGLFFSSFDEDGVESVRLYPTPTAAGISVLAKIVRYPDVLTADDDVTPWDDEFDRGPLDYAMALSYTGEEDNNELRQFHEDRFDNLALELRRLRTSKMGRGPRQLKVKGKTA